MTQSSANVDPQEISKFGAMADLWWQLDGEFKALHQINPVRLAYIRERAGLAGRKVLDIGCGGGLLSEAMAKDGAEVTGIDMVPEALSVARQHAGRSDLAIDYQLSTAEDWAQHHGSQYDVVTCMELVEHVPDPSVLVAACAQLVHPGGDLFFATVNRTPLANLLVIVAAEYLMGIVRRGTHTYAKFVRPQELIGWGRRSGLTMAHLSGLRYIPVVGYARLCKSVSMNYLVHFKKERSV